MTSAGGADGPAARRSTRWKTCWTAGRWPARAPPGPAAAAGCCGPRGRPWGLWDAAGAGAGNITGTFESLPPSPELLAQVDALPPAKDTPDVDLAQARAGDRHFTLRRLLRPLAVALVIGLLLDGLDAVAGLALPALVRNGIDNGVQTKVFHAIVVVSLIGLAIVLADWVVNIAETMVVGRNGERLLYTLRVKLFAQLQRLGLDFYERELSGRIMTRMTTDVDALSSFLQTGLITMVSSVLTFFGVLAALLIINLQLGLAVLCIFPVLVAATLVFRAKSAKAYTESREKVGRGQRRLRGERGRAAGDPGVPPRAGQPGPVRRAEPGVPGVPAAGAALHRASTSRSCRPCPPWPARSCWSSRPARCTAGRSPTGALIAYLLYIDMVFSPVQQLSQVFDGYQQAMVGLRRITDLLRLRTSTPPAQQPVTAGRLDGRIELRDVDFSYGAVSGHQQHRGERAVRDQPDHRARRDRRPGRPDRGGQVHAGQAHRPVLRRDRRAGAGRRHRRPRLRPGQLPAPARRRPAGVVPVRRARSGTRSRTPGRTPPTPRSRPRPGRPARTR